MRFEFSESREAKPVQYVKICSLYGVGFYYMPGTDMCLKVGGWARFEAGYGFNGSFSNEWFEMNFNNETTHDLVYRVKGTATLDARNATPYGTVRSYMALGTSNNNVGTAATQGVAGNYFNRWFIQWAGFTFGHATSFFDFYSVGRQQYSFANGADTGDGGWDVVGYTAKLGNGLSATASAEMRRNEVIINTGNAAGAAVALAANAAGAGYAGFVAPDLVGNLRIDQAWGSAQVMGAWHLVNSTYFTAANQATGAPSDKSGYALGGGILLKLPMIGPRTDLAIQAVYTKGASAYTNPSPASGDFVKFDGPATGGTGSAGFGIPSDAVFGGRLETGNATALQLTETLGIWAGLYHWWNNQWSSRVWFNYRDVDYNATANALLCVAQGQGAGTGTGAVAAGGCNNDFSMWAVGHVLQWNVTSTFHLGLEVVYAELNSASASGGAAAITAAGDARPTATYSVKDQDNLSVRVRVNRPFYN